MDNPHDKLFKVIYGRPAQARAFFEAFLPAVVTRHLDLSKLKRIPGEFVDRALKGRHADLLFRVPIAQGARAEAGGDPPEALVYLLFEHQSTVDPLMAYRLLRYMVRIWERWLDRRAKAPGRPTRLPPIIPLVL